MNGNAELPKNQNAYNLYNITLMLKTFEIALEYCNALEERGCTEEMRIIFSNINNELKHLFVKSLSYEELTNLLDYGLQVFNCGVENINNFQSFNFKFE